METITNFKVSELPNSSYNIFLGKRRSGKSVLAEYLIYEMIKEGLVDMIFLFSPTMAGFKIIKDPDFKFSKIDKLFDLIKFYEVANEYNKVVSKGNKIRLKSVVIIDDHACNLKSKNFNILEELAVLGRHKAYEPLSLSFFILAQSLTKIPRVCRLNADNIFMNAIASERERQMVLDENMYLIDGSRQGKNEGRDLYQGLVTSEDFLFMVIENWRQNVTKYSDYIKKYKADITKLDV